jgi:hypothetical protein
VTMRVHLRLGTRHAVRYACGTGRRWGSQTVTSAAKAAMVTCRGCLRTRAARAAD